LLKVLGHPLVEQEGVLLILSIPESITEQSEQKRSREGNCHIRKNASSKTVEEVKWKSTEQQKLKLRGNSGCKGIL
jgi:hypothetical protein